jgi:hypothetical protein
MNLVRGREQSLLQHTLLVSILYFFSQVCLATPLTPPEVTLEQQVLVTHQALFFDGIKKTVSQARTEPYIQGQKLNYAYGKAISPHGDAIKAYQNYVFMTWYRGGIQDRHVMLSRYNTQTGTFATVAFPHKHTGFEGRWWVGETHNTIAIGISPKDQTIHLLYDMHAYRQDTKTGGNGSFESDYFRYSYSLPGAATVSDQAFTLNQFVKDTSEHSDGDLDYKHVTMTGVVNHDAFSRLTYPAFFMNDEGDLFMHMRQGSSHDGRIVFNKYQPKQAKWSDFTHFNVLGAGNKGAIKNWSIYGSVKHKAGKIRVGFQRRFNLPDKFRAQDGMYYAYSDDPNGKNNWKNYQGKGITTPLVKAEEALVFKPSSLLPHAKAKNQVSITGGFDWTVTDRGDVHMIGRTAEYVDGKVKQNIYHHSYQKQGKGKFVTTTNFPSASNLYATGNYIYIIGLENGYPFVEQASGGSSDFKRVYKGDTSGTQFEKGVVHIHAGKLYYYLLENGTGDTRSIHLQIINLGTNSL